jgi:hypothetical protein
LGIGFWGLGFGVWGLGTGEKVKGKREKQTVNKEQDFSHPVQFPMPKKLRLTRFNGTLPLRKS